MTEIRTILFASDLSPESDRAFEHARFLAERFGARLTIYHGLEMPRTEYSGWVDANDDHAALLWVVADNLWVGAALNALEVVSEAEKAGWLP